VWTGKYRGFMIFSMQYVPGLSRTCTSVERKARLKGETDKEWESERKREGGERERERESEGLRRRYHLWRHPHDLSRLLVEVKAEERRVRQTLPHACLVPRHESFDKRGELWALQHRPADSIHLLRGQRSRLWQLDRVQLPGQRIRTL
jgi:hypothetical protein